MKRSRHPYAPTTETASASDVAPELLAQQCAVVLFRTVPAVMQYIRAEIRQTSSTLSVPQFRLLAYLEQQPGSCLSQVAEYLDVAKATASVMIERLVQSNHVNRTIAPQERRHVRLQLTEHGLQELEAMRQTMRKKLASSLDSLTPEQLCTIQAGLEILQQVFQPTHE